MLESTCNINEAVSSSIVCPDETGYHKCHLNRGLLGQFYLDEISNTHRRVLSSANIIQVALCCNASAHPYYMAVVLSGV